MDWLLYENEAASAGYKSVCGVDEAGRGPLAGPVFAAAVILKPGELLGGVNDSKKLTEKKREELFDVISEKALSFSIASASVEEIDSLNILNATFLAMRRAVEGLDVKADMALIDGNRTPPLSIPCKTIIKGDSLSESIAAASILAKVSRDRYMYQLDKEFPQYCYAQHKGYGTKLHYECLGEYGVSEHHRKTFLKNLGEHLNDKG